MRKIALVGSTGSIGRQVINVIKSYPEEFSLCAIVAKSSYGEFSEQLNSLKPPYAALIDKQACKKVEIPDCTAFYEGDEGALEMLENCGADTVFVACSGFAGLKYSLKAKELGLNLALANKETLVCGGELLMPYEKIAPVDSEHSAIWQCLDFNRDKKVKKLIITASGGPFRGREFSSLSGVTPQEALAHPTWSMGAKITVDSATLLNKGYEVIEAHSLYGTPYSDIITVIQPQSIIHSMVEFEDGAYLAQLGNPTMELPIQLALTFPKRLPCPSLKPLDFTKDFSISFTPLVRKDYPLYDLALRCGESGKTYATALNAASEQAVYAFLKGKIRFTDILRVAETVVQEHGAESVVSYDQLERVDSTARAKANKIIEEVAL